MSYSLCQSLRSLAKRIRIQGSSEPQELAWTDCPALAVQESKKLDYFSNRSQSLLGHNDFLRVKASIIPFHDPVVPEKLDELDVLCLQKINNISGVNSIQQSLTDRQLL